MLERSYVWHQINRVLNTETCRDAKFVGTGSTISCRYQTLGKGSCLNANFVVTDGTASYYNENLWYLDNFPFPMTDKDHV